MAGNFYQQKQTPNVFSNASAEDAKGPKNAGPIQETGATQEVTDIQTLQGAQVSDGFSKSEGKKDSAPANNFPPAMGNDFDTAFLKLPEASQAAFKECRTLVQDLFKNQPNLLTEQDPKQLAEDIVSGKIVIPVTDNQTETGTTTTGLQESGAGLSASDLGVSSGEVKGEVSPKYLTEVKSFPFKDIIDRAGLSGMDVSSACFVVIMMCIKDRQEEARYRMSVVKFNNEGKKIIRENISKLQKAKGLMAGQQADDKGRPVRMENGHKYLPPGNADIGKDGFEEDPNVPQVLDILKNLDGTTPDHLMNGKKGQALDLTSGFSKRTLEEVNTLLDQQKTKLDAQGDVSEQDNLGLQMCMDGLSRLLQMASNLQKKMADTQAAIVQNMK